MFLQTKTLFRKHRTLHVSVELSQKQPEGNMPIRKYVCIDICNLKRYTIHIIKVLSM